jgi:hypothetical protein
MDASPLQSIGMLIFTGIDIGPSINAQDQSDTEGTDHSGNL